MRTLARLLKAVFQGVAVRAIGAAAAAAVVLLAAGQPAKAGDGGDLGGLQAVIGPPDGSSGLCAVLGMGTDFGNTCPQLPTISQAILEIATLLDSPSEAVRGAPFGLVAMGTNIDANNPSRPPALNQDGVGGGIGNSFPIAPSVLSSLTPLAFVSARHDGAAIPVQLYNPAADTFVSAVASTLVIGQPYPDTLFLFYEDTRRDNKNFRSGQTVAKFSLPLVKLSGGVETPYLAILNYKADKKLDCAASTLSGGLSGSPAKFGIDCAVVFAPTPTAPRDHAIFEVSVPLVITQATDPEYFTDPYNLLYSGFGLFTVDLSGPVGIAPSASPLGASAIYALCADLPTAWSGPPVHAAAAFYAIATDAEALLSAPLAAKITITCPSGM
jgi:hypothetical protein